MDNSPILNHIHAPEAFHAHCLTNRRLIGLTGGIATGKTTVSNYLATVHQLPILDADRYAREAVQPGCAILQRIVDRYGKSILSDGKHLDRQRLGNIVFQDDQERQWLEAQIHPYVAQCFTDLLKALESKPVIVLVIPLLFESNITISGAKVTDLITEIWVVSCPVEQQIQRLMERNKFTLPEAQARIQAQMPLSEKCARADAILDNASTVEALLQQVDRALLKNSVPYQLTSPRV